MTPYRELIATYDDMATALAHHPRVALAVVLALAFQLVRRELFEMLRDAASFATEGIWWAIDAREARKAAARIDAREPGRES